jgi:hypothetical protein
MTTEENEQRRKGAISVSNMINNGKFHGFESVENQGGYVVVFEYRGAMYRAAMLPGTDGEGLPAVELTTTMVPVPKQP